MKETIIITGETGSGKSTALADWAKSKGNCAGIITVIMDDRRTLLNLQTNTVFPFEAEKGFQGEIIGIGRYKFIVYSFVWAEAQIELIDFGKIEYFVLDEIGLLELNNCGFHNLFLKALSKMKDTNCSLVLVVRKSILQDIIDKYKLVNVKVIIAEELKNY